MDIREALESAVGAAEAKESSIGAAANEAEAKPVEEAVEASPVETETQKAERLRDEKGRFVEGKAEQKEKAVAPAEIPAPVETPVPRPPRPSSWKKDYWDHWEKLDPKVAEYINQREGEYAKGVSTYKAEYDRVKPLMDALGSYEADITRRNIKPEQWIQNMANAERALLYGAPDQKLSMFLKLAQDYQVPLQSLFTQGQDGRVYFNPQVQAYQPPQPQAQQPVDVEKRVREVLAQEKAQQAIADFEREAPTKYPHYERVKGKMAQLLESGLAQDIPGAYATAVKLDDELFAHEQEAKRKADEASRLEAQRKATAAAKASAVSVKSATPATAGSAPKKGIRSQLEDAYDQHASGRV